jgi:hypothetical protein
VYSAGLIKRGTFVRVFEVFLLSLLLVPGVPASTVPSSAIGKWKIGKPFHDMASQPIGLSSKQEKMLIGQVLGIESTSITACGLQIHIDSVHQAEYSSDAFLERYRISPSQIGLNSPVFEYSFEYSKSEPLCGNSEGLVLITDGQNFTFGKRK